MVEDKHRTEPAPLETERGEQQDDNIDDLGHRPDGTEQDQPVDPDDDESTGSRGSGTGSANR